jgi:hypothetical protein
VIIVVSDTSPIRALSHLDLLTVLEELFSQVIVPPAVARELLEAPFQTPAGECFGLRFCASQGTVGSRESRGITSDA